MGSTHYHSHFSTTATPVIQERIQYQQDMGLASLTFDTSGPNLPAECKSSPLSWHPLIISQNLATLLTRTSYSELRTSFRRIHEGLHSGLGVPLARKQAQILRSPFVPPGSPLLATVTENDCGDSLTGSMLDFYAVGQGTGRYLGLTCWTAVATN